MKWLLLLAAAAPAFSQCNPAVTPLAFNIPANGVASGQITVSIAANCSWGFATDSPSWISFPGAGTDNKGNYLPVTGPGVLNFSAAASTLPVPRQAVIQAAGINVTINQAAANCAMILNPASATIAVTGGNGSFQVQTPCTWVAGTGTNWLTVSPTAAFTGSGAVSYTAVPNPCVDPRTGTVVLAATPNQTFTLTQLGADSNLTVNPTSLNIAAAGTKGSVITILTGAGCPWSAFVDVNFVHFTSQASGTGVGSLGYTIDVNQGAARSGNIHIGNLLLPVAQAGTTSVGPAINAVVNAAASALAATSVSPGEIVTLYGTAMGPTPGVAASPSASAFPTNVSNVQVQFDGVSVPLLYAGAGQINAIAPYRLTPGSSTKITVLYNGATSAAVTMPVTAATPGIISQDGSGTGIGAILNQDYSVNARLRPASRGDVIAIYMVGTGATSPTSTDGAIIGLTPPFPAVAQTPVTVTIGGVTIQGAQVLYAGAAPGSVAGLTQIDVAIPQNVTPSLTTPVTVSIGGVSTQSGITVAIQ